jgi:hypothetical protein
MDLKGLGIAMGAGADAWRKQSAAQVMQDQNRRAEAEHEQRLLLAQQQEEERQRQMAQRSAVEALSREKLSLLDAVDRGDYEALGGALFTSARQGGYAPEVTRDANGQAAALLRDAQGGVINQYPLTREGAMRAIEDNYLRKRASILGDASGYFDTRRATAEREAAQAMQARKLQADERLSGARVENMQAENDWNRARLAAAQDEARLRQLAYPTPEEVQEHADLLGVIQEAGLAGNAAAQEQALMALQSLYAQRDFRQGGAGLSRQSARARSEKPAWTRKDQEQALASLRDYAAEVKDPRVQQWFGKLAPDTLDALARVMAQNPQVTAHEMLTRAMRGEDELFLGAGAALGNSAPAPRQRQEAPQRRYAPWVRGGIEGGARALDFLKTAGGLVPRAKAAFEEMIYESPEDAAIRQRLLGAALEAGEIDEQAAIAAGYVPPARPAPVSVPAPAAEAPAYQKRLDEIMQRRALGGGRRSPGE